jgi:hypothetical protein
MAFFRNSLADAGGAALLRGQAAQQRRLPNKRLAEFYLRCSSQSGVKVQQPIDSLVFRRLKL